MVAHNIDSQWKSLGAGCTCGAGAGSIAAVKRHIDAAIERETREALEAALNS